MDITNRFYTQPIQTIQNVIQTTFGEKLEPPKSLIESIFDYLYENMIPIVLIVISILIVRIVMKEYNIEFKGLKQNGREILNTSTGSKEPTNLILEKENELVKHQVYTTDDYDFTEELYKNGYSEYSSFLDSDSIEADTNILHPEDIQKTAEDNYIVETFYPKTNSIVENDAIELYPYETIIEGFSVSQEAEKRANIIKDPRRLNEKVVFHKKMFDITTASSNNVICKVFGNETDKLQDACKVLTKENCITTPCCVYLQTNETNGKCVAGNSSGPIYLTENQKPINYDYYYYMNKCNSNKKQCPKN